MTAIGPRPLSPFQELMREWSQLAPYNFVQIMPVSTPMDIDLWKRAVATAMRDLDIPPEAVRVEQSHTDLKAHVDAELNRPFSPEHAPLRFCALDATDGGQWFSAVIDHWVADDFSCRRLLENIYLSYQKGTGDRRRSPLFWAQLEHSSTGWWQGWRSFLSRAVKLRRACRTSLRDPLDFTVRTLRTAFPDAALESIQRLAKQHGVTLHDLFLATTAQAFGAVRILNGATKRNAVAIPSALDLRRFQPEREGRGFGMLVGQYIVSHPRPHEMSLVELAKQIAIQTRPMKATPDDLFAPTLFLWRLSWSRRSKATFFARGAPFVAGLSNVNLTGSWIEQCGIPEYRRFGPTGPVVPMVLMITTLHGRIFVDVTFRAAAFTPVEAEAVVQNAINHLSEAAA